MLLKVNRGHVIYSLVPNRCPPGKPVAIILSRYVGLRSRYIYIISHSISSANNSIVAVRIH